jgi:hypothetical protein
MRELCRALGVRSTARLESNSVTVELDVWLRFAQAVRRPDRLPPESVIDE